MPPLDPLLIGSFPTPPSHIPASPNPPPSRPPSLPLPPVPGPSRISTSESLQLLSTSSSSGSRSRSSSKVSTTSSVDDTSIDSGGRSGTPVSLTSVGHAPFTRAITPHTGIEFLIQEHSAKGDELLNVNLELGDEADVDHEDLTLHRSSPIHLRKGSHHRAANDSISSIDVQDILAATSTMISDDEYDAHIAALRTPQSTIKASTLRAYNGLSLADPIDPQTFIDQVGFSSTPTALAFPSTSPPLSPISPLRLPNKDKDRTPKRLPTPPSSPDIPSILASSTRTHSAAHARTRVSSTASSGSAVSATPSNSRVFSKNRSISRPRVSSTTSAGSSAYGGINGIKHGVVDLPNVGSDTSGRRVKEGYTSPNQDAVKARSDSTSTSEEPTRLSWIPHDEFGRAIPLASSPVPLSRPNSGATESEREESREQRQPDRDKEDRGNDSGSDSSIDLRTPLPHYMLKHGFLSPRSKLLNELEESRSGRESVMSALSTGTSLSKDPRHTEKRRIRHRDGNMLKGGIGLTTGLGWSDSEDEDAPSALTRRLSTLNLSRSTSFASLYSSKSAPISGSLVSSRSFHGKPSKKLHLNQIPHFHSSSPSTASAPSPLSRTYSPGMYDLSEQEPMPPSLDELDEWGVIDAARFSNTTSASLTPLGEAFGVSSSPLPSPVPSTPSTAASAGLPGSQTLPNLRARTSSSTQMPRPSYTRKRSGSGGKSESGSRLSTSTVGSLSSNVSGASGLSASTSFSGFSTKEGIPEEQSDYEDELIIKTTTSATKSKYRAHTMGGRARYQYSKSNHGSSGSSGSAARAMSQSSSKSSTSGQSAIATGLSSSPSTSSSMSIPLPSTPCDDGRDEDTSIMTSSTTTLSGVLASKVDLGLTGPTSGKNKILPPLPLTLRRIPGRKELNLNAADTFMSTPVSGAKVAKREEMAVKATVTPKGVVFPGSGAGSLGSKTRTTSNTSAASGIAAPPASLGRRTPTKNASLHPSLPSLNSTPRPLRLGSSPNLSSTPTPSTGSSKDRAAVPVPSIQTAAIASTTSDIQKPPSSPLPSSTTPQSAPAASSDFRSMTVGPGIPSPMTLAGLADRKPRTGTGMVYKTPTTGPGKLRLPVVAAAHGTLSTPSPGIIRSMGAVRGNRPIAF